MVGGSPRILIIRLSAIGDVVRVLPALQILRDALPDAHIDWVVEKKSADVCRDHPSLDGIIVFDRPEGAWNAAKSFLALCNAIRNRRYDIVIDFHGILKSGLLAWASRAPKRYGFARPRSQEGNFLLFTHHSTLRWWSGSHNTPPDGTGRSDSSVELLHTPEPGVGTVVRQPHPSGHFVGRPC